MTDAEILGVFTSVLRDLLDDDSIELEMSTMRPDVAGWDSFAYVNFIVSIEMEFGIKFAVADVESFVTVGDILNKTRTLLG
jgi:acyl carrier protein